MRILMFHVDYFISTVSEKGRSNIVEDCSLNSRKTKVDEALLVLASVEKQDETNPKIVSERATEEINKIAHQLKVTTIVLHPFAHLFGELSKPEAAIEVLKLTEEKLIQGGFKVTRTPFGWFNTLELRAKGQPIIKGSKNYFTKLVENYIIISNTCHCRLHYMARFWMGRRLRKSPLRFVR